MKVKDLVHYLQYKLQPDDDIVVVWYDREYVTDNTPDELLTDKEIVEQAWQDIIDESQESLEGALDFTQVGYEMVEQFEERLKELLVEVDNV